jgi:hypothetical protein
MGSNKSRKFINWSSLHLIPNYKQKLIQSHCKLII